MENQFDSDEEYDAVEINWTTKYDECVCGGCDDCSNYLTAKSYYKQGKTEDQFYNYVVTGRDDGDTETSYSSDSDTETSCSSDSDEEYDAVERNVIMIVRINTDHTK